MKEFALDALLFRLPIALQLMYDSGLPTTTARTIKAIKNKKSMTVLIK